MSNRTLGRIVFLAVVASFLCGVLACKLVYGQGLPPMAGPLGVPPTTAEINLGRQLFFDPILSVNNTISCSSCHQPDKGWSDGKPVAIGINGLAGTRNSQTLLNVGYSKPQVFWDGRAVETTDQAVLPISNPREMGQQTLQQAINRIRLSSKYQVAFNQVFPVDQQQGSAITAANLARAIASFEATLNTCDAPIDRYLRGDRSALTADARIGYELFKKANCLDCHPAPFYTDGQTHNVGFEFATRGRITDNGRFVVTGRDTDVGAFKTPTLRGIDVSGPYGHNGQMATLERVVEHFNAGGNVRIPRQVQDRQGRVSTTYSEQRESRIDPRIRRLNWTPEQRGYVVRFLREAFVGADYPMVSPP